jgi:hypothetical protein
MKVQISACGVRKILLALQKAITHEEVGNLCFKYIHLLEGTGSSQLLNN